MDVPIPDLPEAVEEAHVPVRTSSADELAAMFDDMDTDFAKTPGHYSSLSEDLELWSTGLAAAADNMDTDAVPNDVAHHLDLERDAELGHPLDLERDAELARAVVVEEVAHPLDLAELDAELARDVDALDLAEQLDAELAELARDVEVAAAPEPAQVEPAQVADVAHAAELETKMLHFNDHSSLIDWDTMWAMIPTEYQGTSEPLFNEMPGELRKKLIDFMSEHETA